MNQLSFTDKTFCLVTGASRGIGQEIAIRISTYLSAGSILILLARSLNNLNAVKDKILAKNKNVQVKIIATDLAKIDNPKTLEQELFANDNLNDIQKVIIFHNAGTIGTLTEALKLSDLNLWQEYYTLNVFSVAIINSVIMSRFENQKKHVINITSMCARKPFQNMTFYCSGKAAREAYFKVFALEQKNDSVILNYSPGPVKTDMFDYVLNTIPNPKAKSEFENMKQVVLNVQQTVDKLFAILLAGDYDTGATIDYFD